MSQLWGIRVAKHVITFPPEDLAGLRARGMGELQKAVAAAVMDLEGVRACKVALHWLGDNTQAEHFEVIFPHDGRLRSRRELRRTRSQLQKRLALSRKPTVHFEYVDASLPLVDQWKKWCHLVRYAAHPSVPHERLEKMEDGELREIVARVSAHKRTIRGYGDWGDRKIKKTVEQYREDYPMVEVEGRDEEEIEVLAGAPCPIPDCTGTLCMRKNVEVLLIGQVAEEIAPGVLFYPRLRSGRRRRETA